MTTGCRRFHRCMIKEIALVFIVIVRRLRIFLFYDMADLNGLWQFFQKRRAPCRLVSDFLNLRLYF